MPTSWLGRVLGVFGVPPGEAPSFYRDILFGLVFAVFAFIAIANYFEHVTDTAFWTSVGVAALALLLVRHKAGILVGFALIVVSRLVFFWVTH